MQTCPPSFAARLLLGFCAVLLLAACAPLPVYLSETDEIPVGSRVDFWVDHDEHGWVESNIHIAYLPRGMTGEEARRWAESVGQRDAGLRWTRYYLLVTLPKPSRQQYRTPVFTRGPIAPQFTK
jgi:hypothetical protein